MKRFKSIVTGVIAIAVAVGSVAIPAPQLFAQQANSASLSIVPKKNYSIEPGKTVKDKLTIRNIDRTSDLTLNLRVVDFTFTDDGGTPKLFLGEDVEQTTWSLKPFLKIPATVTIPKGGSKSLDMSVSVPKGHGAGSYYSAIVYSTGAPDGGNVGLSASGVTLVFANIPGKVKEELKLEEFGVYDVNKKHYTPFTFNEPTVMAYRLKNNGNVTEAPVGSITLRDMFGRETVISNLNPNNALALIGQSRTFHNCIKLEDTSTNYNGEQVKSFKCAKPGLWPGIYNAKLDLYYGQNGNPTRELTGTTVFWYLPWWFIIAVLVFIVLAAFFIRKAVRWINYKLNGGVKLKKRK